MELVVSLTENDYDDAEDEHKAKRRGEETDNLLLFLCRKFAALEETGWPRSESAVASAASRAARQLALADSLFAFVSYATFEKAADKRLPADAALPAAVLKRNPGLSRAKNETTLDNDGNVVLPLWVYRKGASADGDEEPLSVAAYSQYCRAELANLDTLCRLAYIDAVRGLSRGDVGHSVRLANKWSRIFNSVSCALARLAIPQRPKRVPYRLALPEPPEELVRFLTDRLKRIERRELCDAGDPRYLEYIAPTLPESLFARAMATATVVSPMSVVAPIEAELSQPPKPASTVRRVRFTPETKLE